MLNELKKSFSAVIYDRVSSPFYGAFIATWFIWNWKIPYITLFVSEKSLKITKLTWIESNALNTENLFYFPLISTFIVLTILPFVTNGFYWLHIKFNKWKVDKRNTIEMKTLLTVEQSIAIRKEMEDVTQQLNSVLEKKELRIKELGLQLSEEKTSESPTKVLKAKKTEQATDLNKVINDIYSNPRLHSSFNKAVEYIQGGWNGLSADNEVSTRDLAYLEAHDVIESSGDGGSFRLGKYGKDIIKGLYNPND